MHAVGQFAELVHAGGPLVELDQGGIDRQQILPGVRAAEPTEPRVGGRGRVHRQEMEDPATEGVDDVRQLANEVAQLARRRDHGEPLPIQFAGGRVPTGTAWSRRAVWFGPNMRGKAQ